MSFRFMARKTMGHLLLFFAFSWAIYIFVRFYQDIPDPVPFWMESIRKTWPQEFSVPSFIARWVQCLMMLGSGLLVLGVQWVSGNRIRKWLGLFSGHPWIDTAVDIGIGLWCITTFWLALGFLGLWYPVLLFSVLFLMTLFFVWTGQGRSRGLRSLFSWSGNVPVSVRFLTALGILYVLFDLLHAFIPETFYDTLGFILGIPEGWLLKHGIYDNPENFTSGMAHDAGLYFLNGFLLHGTEVAKVLGVFSVPACALLVGGWVEQHADRNAAWAALGVTLTFPLLSLNSWAARADGWMAFFLLLAFYALERWTASEERAEQRWLFFAGLSVGMAFSMKYSAAFCLVAFVLVYGRRSIGRKTVDGEWVTGVLGFLIPMGPWFLKNGVFTGNPFYPYADAWMGGRPLPFGVAELLLRKNHLFEVSGFWGWLKLPWSLTMPGSPFAQMIGPFFLASIPLLFLYRKRFAGFRRPVLAAGVFLVVGVAFSRNLRFEMAAFMVLGGGLVVLAYQTWGEKGLRGLSLVFSGMAVLNLSFLAVLSCFQMDPCGLWTGRETRCQYLERQLPDSYYPMAEWVKRNLKKDARLLIVGDARGLYYDVDRITNWIDDVPFLEDRIKQARDPEDLYRSIHRLGITYLAVNIRQGVNASLQNGNAYRMGPADWGRWEGFLQKYGRVVFRRPWLVVYELRTAQKVKGDVVFDAIPFFSEQAARWFQAKRDKNPSEQQIALENLKRLSLKGGFLNSPEMSMEP